MCIRQLFEGSGDKTKSTNSNNKNKLLWGILVIFMPFFFNVIHLPLVNNNNQNHTGTFLAASTASATKATTISGTTTTTTTTATTNEFGLLVVHCKEPNMTFLNQVPDDWFLRVYETCGGPRNAAVVVRRQNDSAVFVPFNNYRRSEECSAYLDFIVQNYHQLPTIVIFMQSDGLQGYGKPDRNFSGHSPFWTIAQMEHVTREIMLTTSTTTNINNGNSNNQTTTTTQFLHYGPKLNRFGFFVLERPKYSPVFVDLWTNHFALPLSENNSSHKDDATAAASDVWVGTRPSATFAVHRDRIRTRPRETYANLRNAILDLAARGGDTRYYCWDLENTWHVLFGEPYVLPKSSTLDHIPRPMF